VFVKKVIGKKSDGFAIVDNGKVFVIDVGKAEDVELIDFLATLRERWLGSEQHPEGELARLELTVIVSHAHPDHIAALPLLLEDKRFCVTAVYAPTRSYLSLDVPGALPNLTKYENRLIDACQHLAEQGHTAKEITRVPYGQSLTLAAGSDDAVLKIYPAHIDWSQEYPCDTQGIRFLLRTNPESYADCPEQGYTNGALNGNSLWVKLIKGGRSVLFTGDQRDCDEMLGAMIRHYGEEEFKCDVLKIPHHGEGNYSPYMLRVASPDFAVFTTSYEKAMPDTVRLCEELGCINYYTADGNLLFHVDTKEVKPFGIAPR
jgi:hypothetical protein